MFTTIPPQDDYLRFSDEDEYILKIKDWGLVSASSKAAKHEFLYKRDNTTYTVTIKGYESNGDHETAVVSFSNEALHCVHPAYLKEMQSSSFGRESVLDSPESSTNGELPESGEPAQESKGKETKSKKAAKTSKPKLELPSEKVSFEAVVKEFATKYNHFNESEDEILILENVKIIGDNPLEVGEAWCGYSNTLKKHELEVGNAITFDAKIVDKKFNKEIRYKINNPSKIAKQS
ncbi:hypothetical protein [Bacillus sp. CECT 9360]|uniref:hypothetical protein n=1 Tax=Bacillus sp. CECT 9360 TaxID=2845821 RepID=UPI001E3B1654|nr:hypothetical protein [Bacillus sp. CECT 9360]CAH0346409.1 hypothetical protein BCI9360_02743 [Bacillus sp. CECT 9360]